MKNRILILCSLVLLSGCQSRKPELRLEHASEAAPEEEPSVSTSEAAEETVFVDVRGAVVFPGVYELPAGSRVYQAVEAAGGLKPHAAADSVNQARELVDGEQVFVRTKQEMQGAQAENAGGTSDGDQGIDLNTADKKTLCTLPGIGEEKAEAVIAYRTENGPFSSAEEIMKVPGIKEGTYRKIKEYISVR